MTNDILFGEQGREKLMIGVNKLSNAVKTTLGAKGKPVIIGTDFGLPIITKDGVTVARSIMLNDYIENMGAALVKEVASKTAEVAGDGTTTATVLAQSILSKGIEKINEGANQLYLKSGIDKATAAVVDELKRLSKPIEGKDQLIHIATVSANNDSEIGKLIGDAVNFVGVDGNITIEESGTKTTSVTKVDGFKFKQGYLDPYFAYGSNKKKVILEDAYVLMYDKKMSTMAEILPICSKVAQSGKPLLIIAEDVEGEALKSLLVNNLDKKLIVCCVKTPGYGTNRYDLMHDISLLTGGTFVSEDKGIKLEQLSLNTLGKAEKITISQDSTVIFGGNTDEALLSETIKSLKEMIENPNDHDVPFLKHRLSNLTNGVATIKVGGSTEVEVGEKMDRVDDALRATISALEEGYVVGGGSAYLKCLSLLEGLKIEDKDEQVGVDILKSAIQAPFLQILSNAGEDKDWLKEVSDGKYGWGVNVRTGKYENLLEKGIIDPTKVSRVALENAASIAGTFLTTDCIISNISDIN